MSEVRTNAAKNTGTKSKTRQTYKTPRLMQTATPIFSCGFILRFHINFHERTARTKSMAAEYARQSQLAARRQSGIRGVYLRDDKEARTTRRDESVQSDIRIPTRAGHGRGPRLFEGRALDPRNESAEHHENIHRDENGP